MKKHEYSIIVDGGEKWTSYAWGGFPQEEPFKDKTLHFDDDAQQYVITTHTTAPRTRAADGLFLIVVTTSEKAKAYVRRAPNCAVNAKRDSSARVGPDRGHSSIACGNEVVFAGEASFSEGKLKMWNRWTGHYLVAAQYKVSSQVNEHVRQQTRLLVKANGDRLLPMESFDNSAWEC